jgi:sugar O-acyltransferase (sialic acid O-acetyltransferase NeuD family)
MSDLVLWGASGHGKVVLDVARATGGFRTISFIDDACEEPGREFCDRLVYGADRYLDSLGGPVHSQYLVSIGQNVIREKCFARALACGLLPATLIHPSAIVSDSARIAEGSVVMPRVVINASAQIGRNCIINTAAVVEHDCRIGDHVHLSPGVLLGGGVTVHSFAHVGIGAVALPGAEIGEGAVVGAGAVVLDSVPPGATVIGVPARALALMRS